jgi:hypothetical protein
MSRSFHSPRHRFHLHASHKRARHAVVSVLSAQARRSVNDPLRLVLADQLEERGLVAQAEALRREDDEALLPIVPSGFNTRLRW